MTEWAGNLTEKILALKKAVSVSFQHSGFSQWNPTKKQKHWKVTEPPNGFVYNYYFIWVNENLCVNI